MKEFPSIAFSFAFILVQIAVVAWFVMECEKLDKQRNR